MYKFQIPATNGGDDAEIFLLADDVTTSGELTSNDTSADESVVSTEETLADESVVSTEETSADEGVRVFKSGFEDLKAGATLAEKAAYGGKVTLIGMTTVFLVLIILWAICALMGKIFGSAVKAEKKVGDNANAPIQPEPKVNSVSANNVAQAPVATVDYSTVSVVASAAIAAFRGEDTVNFTISSIKPCGNGAVALPPEVVAQIAASIACLEGKDEIDFTISSIRII